MLRSPRCTAHPVASQLRPATPRKRRATPPRASRRWPSRASHLMASTIAFVSGGDIWAVPARWRRRPPARLASGHRIASALLARRQAARLHVDAHRRRRHLRPDARHRRSRAPHLRRRDGAARRVVAPTANGSTSPRTATTSSGMHDVYRVRADGGTPMPVAADRYTTEYFAAPRAGGRRRRDHRARQRRLAVVAQRPQSSRRERDLARRRGGAGGRAVLRARSPTGGAKDAWPMWSARRQVAVLHVRPQRRAEYLELRAACSAAPGAAKPVTTFKDGRVLWPSISQGRQDDRLRARLRHLDGRHGHAARRARSRSRSAARRRPPASSIATFSDQIPGARALAGREEGRVHGPRRDLLGVGEGWRRRAARHDDARAKRRSSRGRPTAGGSRTSSDRDGTRPSVHLRLRQPARETQLTTGHGARRSCRGFRPMASGSRSSATRASCACIDPATQAGEAGRHRRLRHAAVRRRARLRLVARLALHRVSHGGREDVSERRRVVAGRAGGGRRAGR